MVKTLRVFAHCRDNCVVAIDDEDGHEVAEHIGYVPHDVGIGGGDDVELAIDIETGQIIGWDAEKVKTEIWNLIKKN